MSIHQITQNRPTTRQWWDDQPAPVRAVLDLAWMRRDATDEIHDNILGLVAPGHAGVIADIAGALFLAEDYDCGLLDAEVPSIEAAEVEVERLRGDALCSAQLVASLIGATR